MRKRFDRSLELDGKKRDEVVMMIKRHVREKPTYTELEESIIKEAMRGFGEFDKLKANEVKMRSPQTKGLTALEPGNSQAWGWSSTTVRAR
jgi:hypothetical protein